MSTTGGNVSARHLPTPAVVSRSAGAGRSGSIGVLALQGNHAAHCVALRRLGADVREIRRPQEMAQLSGLVLPGGESTTLLHLLDLDDAWLRSLVAFHDRGGSLFATCAGLILLASRVRGPSQPSLGLLDVTVERNGYGRQVDSFEATGIWCEDGSALEMVFIRAPRIRRIGSGVEVLATWRGEPALLRQGSILGATFHPELTADRSVQRLFLDVLPSA